MSAFVVNPEHINAMVDLALTNQPGPSFHYWHEGSGSHEVTMETRHETARMLLRENIESVAARYPDDDRSMLPGPFPTPDPDEHQHVVRPGTLPNPVEALKLIRCYEYQSCEHAGWESSEAAAFCKFLTGAMIAKLPGYSEAPWEWEPVAV